MAAAHADMLAARETILEALADALAGSASAEAALALVEGAAGEARPLAHAAAEALRRGTPLPIAIADGLALDDRDRALLVAAARDGASSSMTSALRAVADRVRVRAERRRTLRAALSTPIGLMALGIAIEPLPNLVTGGGYLGPVLRGLAELALVVGALMLGVPRLLRVTWVRVGLLDLLAALPFVGASTRAATEADVARALAHFADGTSVDPAGLRALAVVGDEAGGPLAQILRDGRASLERVGTYASTPLRLLLATAPAARRLDERLARFGRDATDASTRALRRTVAAIAWTVMIAASVPMLARTLAGGLGAGLGGAKIPGLELPSNAEQEELDKLLNDGR